jgi:methionyl-tRNA synthetase
MFGREVFFLTGTDEHGQKIAARAAKEGLEPIDICNRYATKFQALNKRLNISNDAYIRTTQEAHKSVAQTLWRKCLAKGDIWLGTYSGWYDVGEEAYVTDADAEKMGYKDKSGNPLKEMAEPSYLFNMEKYRAELLARIKSDAFRIQPPSRRKEILTRLENTELFNLSISRTNFSWGIPVPDDAEHVMYVWFDALTNYGSGVNFLDQTEANPLRAFWPATTHVIGKDIIWFHCVIWPIMLLSAEVPLPRGVFAHGFVNDALGKKMSKSVGNVIDPNDILDKYGADTTRFYTVCETTYGEDMPFSEEHLVDLHNANLADGIGNLLRRGLALCAKYKPGPPLAAAEGDGESKAKGGDKYGLVPSETPDVPFDSAAFARELDEAGRDLRLKDLCTILMAAVADTNKYLTNAEPWKMKDQPERQRAVVRTILEACYYFAHALNPLCPDASAEIFRQLKCPARTLGALSAGFDNLVPGAPIMAVTQAPILFTKIERAKSKEEIKAEMKKAKAAKNKAKGGKKNGGGGGGGSAPDPNQDAFTKIDIRVGQIAEVWVHENADSLYCEKINVGEEEPRQIASGLRKHYPNIEDLQDRKVLVVCNLKSSNLVGFKSFGMVLCAVDSESGKTEIIDPPAGAKVGERVFVDGFSGNALTSSQVKKKKAWRALQPSLKTTEKNLASWDGKVIQTSAGPCKAASLCGVQIK